MASNPVQTTYSFKDLLGALLCPALSTPIQLVGGNIGNGQIVIRMLTKRTEHAVGADGTVMPTYVSGANGEVTIEVQQTSSLHHELLDLYNALVTQSEAGDVSNWASIVLDLRTVLDDSGHLLTGVSFDKIPDKPYAAHGQNVTWTLMAASVVQQ